MIGPIEGAVYDPQPVVVAALAALSVQNVPSTQSYVALTARGGPERRVPVGLSVRHASPDTAAYLTMNVGQEGATSQILVSMDVVAERVRAGRVGFSIQGNRFGISRTQLEVGDLRQFVVREGLTVGGPKSGVARMSLEARTADVFTIIADIIETIFVPTAGTYYPAQYVTGRLYVNNVNVPISGFNYQKPRDRLGALLNVNLANIAAGLAQVPFAGNVRFALVVTDPVTEAVREFPLVEGGKIGGRDFTIALRQGQGTQHPGPADEISISSLDVLADKYNLAPRIPVTMYDPNRVSIDDTQVDLNNAVLDDQTGSFIIPSFEAVGGLTAYTAIRRAISNQAGSQYITPAPGGGVYGGYSGQAGTGMGFTSFVTNIGDYPISRADFTMEGGWFDGIQPFIAMYEPSYFVLGTTFFIVDTQALLPYGYVAKPVRVRDYKQLGLNIPHTDPVNAVLLTHVTDVGPADYYYTYRFDQRPDKVGDFGELGYQRTETTIQIRQTRSRATGEILSEVPLSITARTFGYNPTPSGGPGALMEMHRETQQNFYEGELKSGHDKRVFGLIITGPDASLELQPVLSEKNQVVWIEDPTRPGVQIQYSSTSQIRGIVYEMPSERSVLTPSGYVANMPLRYSVIQAQKSDLIDDDGHLLYDYPIKTITETLRVTRGAQLDVAIKTMDWLTGTVQDDTSQPRTGSRSINGIRTRQRRVLLVNQASVDLIGFRKPVTLNAGELPEDRAMALARRKRDRLTNPQQNVPLQLPGVDLSLDRGSVIRPYTRQGQHDKNCMVLGLTITGNNLGQRRTHRISMSLDSVELLS